MRWNILLAALAATVSPAAAERNLVPSLGSEPDWMQSIGIREAYKRVLVQDIYRAQSMERIVAAHSCACDVQFPSWEAAEAEFHERISSAERWEMLEASDGYNSRANAMRAEAMAICQAAGNW